MYLNFTNKKKMTKKKKEEKNVTIPMPKIKTKRMIPKLYKKKKYLSSGVKIFSICK